MLLAAVVPVGGGVVNLAAAAITAVLALSSGRNMIQTWTLSRQQEVTQPNNNNMTFDNIEMAMDKIQTMKRKDLLQLYLSCHGPQQLQQIQGEWNGILLDNDNWVMVRTKVHTYHLVQQVLPQ